MLNVLWTTIHYLKSIVMPIMVILVVDVVFKISTLYPNVNIKVRLIIFKMMLKMMVVMWVVDMGFKTATLSPKVTMQVPLRRVVGISTRAILLVDMVIWTAILIYKKMVCNNWWMTIIVLIQIWIRIYRM